MSDRSNIEWTDATWNPVTGCTKVSPGCDHCYAETLAERFRGTPGHYYEQGFDLTLRPEKLDQPLRWKRPRLVFVNSMSDLFHDAVPDDYIAQVFAVMSVAKHHTFQLLTKRHGRMRALLRPGAVVEPMPGNRIPFRLLVNVHRLRLGYPVLPDSARADGSYAWPLPNVWLGVSVEDQKRADLRVPALLDTPAAVRFLSCEPLLGRVDLSLYLSDERGIESRGVRPDWVIVGGESGKGARPMHPDWARLLRDQCETAGVPFHFKQRGEWTWNEPGRFALPSSPLSDRVAVMHPAGMTAMRKGNPFNPFDRGHPNWATRIERVGKRSAGRLLDGRTHDDMPAVTR